MAVLVAGGVCGYRAYEGHQVSVARDACQSAVADQAKAVKAYKTLLGSDDTMAALKTDAKSVKDARTVDTLAKAAKAKLPAMVKCDVSKTAGLDAAAMKAGKAVKTVKADVKALDAAVKAVETSKLDKTVANAEALYKATDGKVQDDKTREALAKAVKARDAKAIAKAVKAVNDSKTAKERADAEAAAKAQAEQEPRPSSSRSPRQQRPVAPLGRVERIQMAAVRLGSTRTTGVVPTMRRNSSRHISPTAVPAAVEQRQRRRTALYSADVQLHRSNHRFLFHRPRRRGLVVISCKRRRPHSPRRMGLRRSIFQPSR